MHKIFATDRPSGRVLTEQECHAANARVGKFNGPQRVNRKKEKTNG